MPPIKQLDLNSALEDSPETRKLALDLEQQATTFHKFVVTLLADCRQIADLERQMSSATKQLSNHLLQAKAQNFCAKSSFMAGAVEQLGDSLQQQCSWQEMLHTQIQDGVLQPLQQFLQDDLLEIDKLKDNFVAAVQDHDNAMNRYSRVSKKKETERVRFEANADLYTARKKFHQTALQFYSALNLWSRKREFGVLDPLLSFMHSQLSYFKMGHDILTEEVAKFLTSLSVQIQKEKTEHTLDAKRLSSLREKIEQEYSSRYNPDPDPSDPFSEFQPPDLSLSFKSGYLYLRSKGSSRGQWEKMYFFTKDGLIMTRDVNKEPSPVMLLDLSTTAHPADYDDRRYVFQVVSATTKETIILQAENEHCREEWIAAIRNIVTELTRKAEASGQAVGLLPSSRLSKEAVQEERKRISNWVDDVIKVEGVRNTPPQQRANLMAGAAPGGRPMAAGPATGGLRTRAAMNVSPSRSPQPSTEGIPQDFVQTYTVRFLGSLAVQQAKGSAVAEDTMRQVMHARAVQNVFKKVESTMLISSRGLRLIDPSNGSIRTEFRVQDISFAAAHRENQRLFAFITRSPKTHQLACHVFESDKPATELCEAMSLALQMAFRSLQARRLQLQEQQRMRQRQQQQYQQQQQRQQMQRQQLYQQQLRQQQMQQRQQRGLPPVSGRPGIVDDFAAQGSWSSEPDDRTYATLLPQEAVPAPHQATQPSQQKPPPQASGRSLDQSALYSTVQKDTNRQSQQRSEYRSLEPVPPPIYQPLHRETFPIDRSERPTSVSPLSTDSSTTTTSTSSSDADAIGAGLTISSSMHQPSPSVESSDQMRENPFNSPSMSAEPSDTAEVIGNAMLPSDQWEGPSQGGLPGEEGDVGAAAVADVNAIDDLMHMDFSALNLGSGLVAPSTTPAMPGLLDSTAADAAMAVAMAAAATLHNDTVGGNREEEDTLQLEPGSPSSALSDLSDS